MFILKSQEFSSICWFLIKYILWSYWNNLLCSQDLKGTCSGIALVSAEVHLLAWWISGLRTQLLCGNQGDKCCQATTGLDQCAYTVKKQHKCLCACTTLGKRNSNHLMWKIIQKCRTSGKLQPHRRTSLSTCKHRRHSPCCRSGLLFLFCHCTQTQKGMR